MPNRQSTSYGLETVEGMGIRSVYQQFDYSDMTDSALTGYIDLNKQIPAGSFVIGSKVDVLTAFDGGSNTTFTLDVGTSSDDDHYSYTTHDVSSATTNLLEPADYSGAGTTAGLVPVTSDTTVRVTVDVDNDYTTVDQGEVKVWVFYLSTNIE